VEETLRLVRTHDYHRPFRPLGDVEALLLDAEHILGSASVALRIGQGAETLRIGFSGDLGRREAPILRDPDPLEPVDVLLCESTYGDRLHEEENTRERLAAFVGEAVERGGKLLFPAFALGRAQTLLYLLHDLFVREHASKLLVFIDSPLTLNTTEISRRHPECFDAAMRGHLARGDDPFAFPEVRKVRSVDESKAINDRGGALAVIAGSGMCESGRILHHLKRHLPDSRTVVVMLGFQAEHTLGRRLLSRPESVRIFGEEVAVAGRVESLSGLSAHADRSGLTRWLLPQKNRLRRVFLVHGEPEAAEAFREHLRGQGFPKVDVPQRLETVEVP